MYRTGGVHRDAAPGPLARDLVQERLDVGLAEVTQLDAVHGEEPAERLTGVDIPPHRGTRVAERCQLPDHVVEVRPDGGGVAVLLDGSSVLEELLDHLRLLSPVSPGRSALYAFPRSYGEWGRLTLNGSDSSGGSDSP